MEFFKYYSEILKEAIIDSGYEIDCPEFIITSRPDLGQFQCNDAMKLAKKYKKPPYQIASEIVNKLKKCEDFLNLSVASPGFINISLTDEAIINHLHNYDFNFNKELKKSKKIFLDYGGANIAKSLHVGHIRSANIGEALKRLCISLGYNTISDVHLGDWGLQMGMIIYEIKQKYPFLPYFDENVENFDDVDFKLSNSELEYLYPEANKKAKEDGDVMEKVHHITSDLQNGKKGYVALWKKILECSVSEIKKAYDQLNTDFDLWKGESDASKYVDTMLKFLKLKKLAYEDDGALIMDVSEPSDIEPMPPLILKKSDGADLYSTTELATLYDRVNNYHPDEIWYIVDKRQSLHFKQVFRAAYKSGIVPPDVKLCFIGFGTINDKDGKPFKTRDGKTVTLSKLLRTLQSEIIKNLNYNTSRTEKIEKAKIISIADLKCADLITNIGTDYVFDPVKFTQLNGNTGAYLIYSSMRIKSLLQKNDIISPEKLRMHLMTCGLVREISLKLLTLEKILNDSFKEKSPNKILEYLFDLNKLYNSFYSNNKIISEKNDEKRKSWLFISNLVYNVNCKLLQILAINLP